MTTVPMYTAPPQPDAGHRVTAPGGYEWWYFDAEDFGGQLRVVAILFDGFVFHPGYLREVARFKRNPTRVPPPVPSQYPCAYLAVYQREKLIGQFMSQLPSGGCIASTDSLDVIVGPNRIRREQDGSIHVTLSGRPWMLTAKGPRTLAGKTLAAELVFRPRFPRVPEPRRFLSRDMTGADHFWILADPLCDVSGVIRRDGEDGFEHALRGRGYHDHNVGTGPIGDGLRRWMWGRVLEADRVTTFHAALPATARLPEEVHLVESDEAGVRSSAVTASRGKWDRTTAMLLRYPGQWSLDDRVQLRSPTVIDSTPFYLRLLYDALIDGRPGRALCEIAYPHRLRWPVLGRMIEMSIDRRG